MAKMGPFVKGGPRFYNLDLFDEEIT
jgi:hypothetical protein